MVWYGLAGRLTPARSPCRPHAQENGAFWQAPACCTRRRARWPSGKHARRPAGVRPPASRGRRWPGGCACRRSPRAGSGRTAGPPGRGLSLVGVSGDGEDGGIGGGGIQDEADRLALGVPAGQGDDRGSAGLWPGLLGWAGAVPGSLMELCQHHIGSVDLVAGAAEVLADRPEGGAPADAVAHKPGGLRLVRVGSGACVDAQLCLERLADRSGLGEAGEALGEERCLRPGSQPDSEPPGGEVIDGATPAVSGSDTVADETLVDGQVREPRPGRRVAADAAGEPR